MTGKIFINYRRDDDPGSAGRIFDRLEFEFTTDMLFMDVQGHINAGDDFFESIRDFIDRCDVMLAIIGPRWLESKDANGKSRLEDPDDWVRAEITSALQANKIIIPVLIQDTVMPRIEELPMDMAPMVSRQLHRISHDRFKPDSQELIRQIKRALSEVREAREAETDQEKQAAEDAARRRRTEDEARWAKAKKEAEEREQLKNLEGLSTDDILKREELNNWDFIKNRNDIEELRDHLSRFPEGSTNKFAISLLEELMWAKLGHTDSTDYLELLEDFLDEFPQGAHADEARMQYETLKSEEVAREKTKRIQQAEIEAWLNASLEDTTEAYKEFIRRWPESEHNKMAKSRIRGLKRNSILRRGGIILSRNTMVYGGIIAFVTLIITILVSFGVGFKLGG